MEASRPNAPLQREAVDATVNHLQREMAWLCFTWPWRRSDRAYIRATGHTKAEWDLNFRRALADDNFCRTIALPAEGLGVHRWTGTSHLYLLITASLAVTALLSFALGAEWNTAITLLALSVATLGITLAVLGSVILPRRRTLMAMLAPYSTARGTSGRHLTGRELLARRLNTGHRTPRKGAPE